MPFFGKVWGGAYGPTSAMILYIVGEFFGGGLLARIYIRPEYTERNYAIFVNGVFILVKECNESGFIECVVPGIASGEQINSFIVEDVGTHSDLDADLLPYVQSKVRQQEALTANSLNIVWDNTGKYKLTTVNGDSQLSSITITGAVRGLNCTPSVLKPTRARLYYTIQTIGSGHFIRWYDGNRLVASGGRTGDGALTCAAIDSSELAIACTLTYTADIANGVAYLDIKWPALYKVFFSTAAINYSGAAQATVLDGGGVRFNYISGVLNSGSYYYNVVSVDDEGDVETGMTDLGPRVINALPDAPVITGVTQLSPFNFRVAFTADAGASSHKIYFSRVNGPINFGNLVLDPQPVVATTPTEDIVVPAFTPQDDEAAYDALEAAFDAAIAAVTSGVFVYGFDFAAVSAAIESAVDDYADAIYLPLTEKKAAILAAGEMCANNLASLDSDAFDANAPTFYGNYLQQLGSLLEDNPTRYNLPDSTVSGSGTLSITDSSLWDVAQPFAKRNLVHIVMRSTLAGKEERNDRVWEIELDASGNLITARPMKPFIISKTLALDGSDRTITIRAGIVEENGEEASHLDLYIYTGAITLGSPTQSVALDDAIAGYKEITFDPEIVAANAWYKITVLARTAGGARSEFNPKKDFVTVNVASDTPVAPGNIQAYVVRSKGN